MNRLDNRVKKLEAKASAGKQDVPIWEIIFVEPNGNTQTTGFIIGGQYVTKNQSIKA